MNRDWRVFQQVSKVGKDLAYHLATWDLTHESSARAVCGRRLQPMRYVPNPKTGHAVCAACRFVVG